MKTTIPDQLARIISLELIEAYNRTQQCTIQDVYWLGAQRMRTSNFFVCAALVIPIIILFIAYMLCDMSPESPKNQITPVIWTVFGVEIFLLGIASRYLFQFIKTSRDSEKIESVVSHLREHYYTGSPDVCLSEELIRKNLVLMARRVLLERGNVEFLKSTGWANEKALQEANEKYTQATQILDRALASMNEFGLSWDKQSIFVQAGNS